MIVIDGSHGEGGGQILRTSLALSLVTGRSFRIENIRAGRKKPGLMRQHLAAVNAAAEVSNAKVAGNTIGSKNFSFEPDSIRPGKYHFAVGTAGSSTLVFQTILPALIMADGASEVVLEGGTHNPYAPPFDFLRNSFLKILNRMGPVVETELQKPGFYPAGGGRFSASIQPVPLKKIELNERGPIIQKRANAVVANLSIGIAHRELKMVRKTLAWDDDCLSASEVNDSDGPGNILTITVESENITEVFTGFGERGVSAENVAKKVIKQVQAYLSADVPVGNFLADQLLIPIALAGEGSYRTLTPSPHTLTNIDIIRKFINIEINSKQVGQQQWEIAVGCSHKISK
jgi:RNA 3'-terminal phosphate cyclase (ATP)